MKLENQVCTLEQAKKLKDLGIDGSQCYWRWWFTLIPTRDGIDSSTMLKSILNDPNSPSTEIYPAFTVAELGEMLPTYEDGVGKYYTIKDVGKLSGDNSNYDVVGWNISESYPEEPHHLIDNLMNCVHATEAQARAAMLIYLLENNLMTASEPDAITEPVSSDVATHSMNIV